MHASIDSPQDFSLVSHNQTEQSPDQFCSIPDSIDQNPDANPMSNSSNNLNRRISNNQSGLNIAQTRVRRNSSNRRPVTAQHVRNKTPQKRKREDAEYDPIYLQKLGLMVANLPNGDHIFRKGRATKEERQNIIQRNNPIML